MKDGIRNERHGGPWEDGGQIPDGRDLTGEVSGFKVLKAWRAWEAVNDDRTSKGTGRNHLKRRTQKVVPELCHLQTKYAHRPLFPNAKLTRISVAYFK